MTQPILDEFTKSFINSALWATINPDYEEDPSVGNILIMSMALRILILKL